MLNKREESARCEAEVVRLPENLRPALPADEVQSVEHLLAVGELEMAFESLVLSVMQARLRLEESEWVHLLELARALGLDRESVYDLDFWQSLVTATKDRHTPPGRAP